MIKALNKYKTVLLSLVLLCLIFACTDAPNQSNSISPFDKDSSFAKVVWIFDGDTFEAEIEGLRSKVRVLDVDVYETSNNERLESQATKAGISLDSALSLGLSAKNWAIKELKNKNVTLIRGTSEPNVDVYGRYLRYVILSGMRLDSLLKSNGWAVP